MPIKETSTFKKHEYEYTSPDTETWRILYVESPGRKYMLIGKANQKEEEMTTWDVAMLLDIADQIRKLTSKQERAIRLSHGGRPRGSGLQKPRIKDHRGGSQPEQIQSQVDESMRQSTDEGTPIQSFSPQREVQEWGNYRAGFDIAGSGNPSETPQEYKYDEGEEGSPEADIAARNANKATAGRPVVTQRGSSGANFRRGSRISASEIV